MCVLMCVVSLHIIIIYANDNNYAFTMYRTTLHVEGVACGGCGMWGVWHVEGVACGGCGMWGVACAHVCGFTPYNYKQEISRDHIPRAVTNLFIKAS